MLVLLVLTLRMKTETREFRLPRTQSLWLQSLPSLLLGWAAVRFGYLGWAHTRNHESPLSLTAAEVETPEVTCDTYTRTQGQSITQQDGDLLRYSIAGQFQLNPRWVLRHLLLLQRKMPSLCCLLCTNLSCVGEKMNPTA